MSQVGLNQKVNKRVIKAISLFLKSSSLIKTQKVLGQPTNARTLRLKNNQSGQVVLEYVLLLFISVTIATFLTKKLVGRNPDSPGIITGAWSQITSSIGADIID